MALLFYIFISAFFVAGQAGVNRYVEDCCSPPSGPGVFLRLYGRKCFYFHLGENLPFEDASAVCKYDGQSLAMPRNLDMSKFIKEQAAQQNFPKVWLGLFHEKSGVAGSSNYRLGDGTQIHPNNAVHLLSYSVPQEIMLHRDTWVSMNVNDRLQKLPFVCESEVGQRTLDYTKIPVFSLSTLCPHINDGEKYMQYFDEKCYFFGVDIKLTLKEARGFCAEHGGMLANVKTQKIDTFLQHELHETYKLRFYSAYIGITSSGETKLKWEDGSPLEYSNFGASQPGGNHAIMSGHDNRWHSYAGDGAYRINFICEFEVTL